MDKKAQSALEYLMTYGWALVVIVIVIAALVFLINPSNVGGNTCTGFPNMVITNHDSNVNGMKIYYSNNAGQTLKSVAITGEGTVGGTAVAIASHTVGTGTVNAGAKSNQALMYTAPGAAGSYVVNMTLSYHDRDDIVRTESASCRGTI